jgi:nucleoside-diphosphate-sugar epimerase
MKKVLVTGGLGFIGSNLIDLLLKKNIQLLILIKSHIHQIFIIQKILKIIKNINL